MTILILAYLNRVYFFFKWRRKIETYHKINLNSIFGSKYDKTEILVDWFN
jgi:hypothetical protein